MTPSRPLIKPLLTEVGNGNFASRPSLIRQMALLSSSAAEAAPFAIMLSFLALEPSSEVGS